MTQSEFLKGVNDWNNHAPLLWLALEATKEKKMDVIEMGCGDGSTRQLHDYCKANQRALHSFDYDKEWLDKFSEYETPNHYFHYVDKRWEVAKEICPDPSVILIDHSPGERRVVDIRAFCDIGGILVIHDTQPPPTAASYGFETIWKFFKYRVDLAPPVNPDPAPDGTLHNRTWASAVSNSYDVTKWKGMKFEPDYELK